MKPGAKFLLAIHLGSVLFITAAGGGARAQVYDAITGCYSDEAGLAPEVCYNHPNAAPSAPPPPDGPFVSVAVSMTTFIVGASYFEPSQAEADKDAVKSCINNRGGQDCRVVSWARKECTGIATSPAEHAAGWAGGVRTRLDAWNAALEQCRINGGKTCKVMVTPCAGDTWQWSPPLPLPPAAKDTQLDQGTVGTWAFNTPQGRWVWEIGAGGTYEFHAETQKVYEPSHAGRFSASNGKWSLEATAGGFIDVDGGTYVFQGPNVMKMSGKYGEGYWYRIK